MLTVVLAMVHHAVTLLTALALLLASGTAVAGEHRCGATSMPSSECCCDHSSDADEADEQRGAEVQGICCEFRAPADRTPPVPPAAFDGHTSDVVAPRSLAIAVAAQPRAVATTAELAPPSVRGPPLFVQHCRFLI